VTEPISATVSENIDQILALGNEIGPLLVRGLLILVVVLMSAGTWVGR